MSRNSESYSVRPGRSARTVVVVLLAALAGGLWLQVGRSFAQDDAIVPASQPGSSIIAVTGQITKDTYGVYLVDTQAQTICVYQYVAPSKILRLLASRTFTFDMMLDAYNTEPSPRQIRGLVDEYNRLADEVPPAIPAEEGGQSAVPPR